MTTKNSSGEFQPQTVAKEAYYVENKQDRCIVLVTVIAKMAVNFVQKTYETNLKISSLQKQNLNINSLAAR